MSATVDDRIVNMQFNNTQFQRGATESMSILDKLKAKLSFKGSAQGLSEVQSAANKFNMNPISTQVEGVNGKFLALATVAATVLSNITSQALAAGGQMVNSFTFKPIIDGLHEYETNLNSVQTIMANTGREGRKGLDEVNAALEELNNYSDDTIYNFGEMARNIGTFTAAGVDLDSSTAAIKGIANLAAVSGSNSQQASTAMYQLSQALAAGKVSLMDWNSVVNAGMGGKVFQEALKETARVHGVAVDDIIKKAGSFRDSISKGWITGEILTETLSKFTGDLSEAQLKQMGYTEEQIAGIVKMGKTATDAATKVKTFSQLISTLQEALGSGWAKTWQTLFGDFDEAKDLFTDISNVLGGFIQTSADARNKVLGDWKALGGRTMLIEGIGNVFKALIEVVKPIREAFREIFPPATGQDLFNMTERFFNFTKTLKIGADTADGLKRTFKGFFAILDIGWEIIKGVAHVIGILVGALTGSSGGILDFTGTIGDFVVALDEALTEGGALAAFFEGLGQILALPVKILGGLGHILGGLFGGFDQKKNDQISDSFGKLGDSLDGLAGLFDRTSDSWKALSEFFQKTADFFQPVVDTIVKTFDGLGDALAGAISTGDFDAVLSVINTGLLGGILLLIKKFFDDGLSIDFGGGMFEAITDTFGQLTSTLKAMQTQIQAKTLLLIAGAVALLTASVVALSLIDAAKLKKALIAMSVGFTMLLAAMGILVKIAGHGAFLTVPVIAGSLILLATAILILTAAVKNLSSLSWSELLKGLTGLAGAMILLVAAAYPLTKMSGGLLTTGTALVMFSIAIKILASAVGDMAELSWDQMARGLTGLAVAIGLIIAEFKLMPPNILLTATALLIVGGAVKAIASAVTKMGGQSWGEVARGLVTLAGALAIIAAAMYLMPPHMALMGAGLILVGIALKSIAKALTIMGEQSWTEVAKGLVTLGGALLILAGGLTLMNGTLAGSAALLVAATALAVLTPVLTTLGAMSWEAIIKGLVGLAGAFTVIGLAGLVLGPLVPVLLGLSAAVLLFGAGVALLGAGALALATAFTMVVSAGSAGLVVISAMASAIIQMIPKAMGAFGLGLIEMIENIAKAGPKMIEAIAKILIAMSSAVIKAAPKMGAAFVALVKAGTDAVIKSAPDLATAGFKLLMAFLKELDDNIYRITTIAISLATKFIRAWGDNQGRLIDAGYKTMIKFINGLAKTIRDNQDDMERAGANLADAIIDGMVGGIIGGNSAVVGSLVDVASAGLNAAKDFLGIKSPSRAFKEVGRYSVEGMALGISANEDLVAKSAENVGAKALDTLRMTMSKIGDEMSANVDMNPTITPVLDLTRLQQEATQISGLLAANPVEATVSTTQAGVISSDSSAPKPEDFDPRGPGGQPPIQLTQNNYSPKALSEIDIYRQTQNLVGGVGIANTTER